MEILKSEQYINEKLNIKPITKDRLNNLNSPKIITDESLLAFMDEHKIKYNQITHLYDCDGDIYLLNDSEKKTVINDDGDGFKIRFGRIKGAFTCTFCKLKSLKGAPQEVDGDFDCSGNELTTLVGSPQKVGGDFYCNKNRLTTLKGVPNTIIKSLVAIITIYKHLNMPRKM